MAQIVEIIGWTLVHFLWQASLVWVLFTLACRLATDQSANVRYLLGLSALAAMALMPIVTFSVLTARPDGIAGNGVLRDMVPWASAELSAMMPLAVLAWAAGVFYRLQQVIRDLIRVGALTRVGCRPLPRRWQALVDGLCAGLAISRPVHIMESMLVQVPAAVGWLRPVVLIPSSALLGLTRQQLELIIVHELAHIKRFDYVINLAQVALETLFFFHPAVLSISRQVRAEREVCCDELVVRRGGNRFQYAQALALLEDVRAMPAGTSTAMMANGGQLLARMERLACDGQARRHNLVGSLALFTAGIAAVIVFITAAVSSNARAPDIRLTVSPAIDTAIAVQPQLASGARPLPDVSPRNAVVPDSASTPAPSTRQSVPARPPPPPVARIALATPDSDFQVSPAVMLNSLPESLPTHGEEMNIAAPSLPLPVVRTAAVLPAMHVETTAQQREADAMALLDARPVHKSPPRSTGTARGIRQLYALSESDGGDLIFRVDPQYPNSARSRGVEGTVTVDFAVNEVGSVEDIQIVSDGVTSGFRRSVKQAVALWKYSPLRRDGLPVTYRQTQTFNFRLLAPLRVAQGQSCIPHSNDTWACRPLQGSPN